jgi:enoyl-CoA hydratase
MSAWGLEIIGRVAILTFHREPSNWMDLVSMGELADHLTDLAGRTDEVSVVMLTGGLDGYFIAHADLDDLAKLARGESVDGDLTSWFRALQLLESMPQPTVAAIDGQAWGGGCETSLACTMRIGSERAHLGQPEIVIGIIPGAGGTQRLPRLVGAAKGAELCLTGRVIQADEAERIGLLNAVLPTEGFREHAVAWCEAIAKHPPGAVFAAKRAVVEGFSKPLLEGLQLEGGLFIGLNASDDAKARNDAVRSGRGNISDQGGE